MSPRTLRRVERNFFLGNQDVWFGKSILNVAKNVHSISDVLHKCAQTVYFNLETFIFISNHSTVVRWIQMNYAKNKTLHAAKLEKDLIENLDDVDLQILSLLQQDSRVSFNKIARNLGISVGTAFNHVKNLEKKGVLKGYTTELDSAKLGYSLTALILIQAEGGYLGEVENEISKAANVIAVYDITGDYDAAVITKFKDRTELNIFIKSLMATPHVKRTVTSVALDVIKEDFRIKLQENAKMPTGV